jgi:hypothetical protein
MSTLKLRAALRGRNHARWTATNQRNCDLDDEEVVGLVGDAKLIGELGK